MTDGSKDIPLKTSLAGSGWSVNSNFQVTFVGTSTGTMIVDKTVVTDADLWGDYVMVGYVNIVPDPASSNHRAGFVMRYQDSDNYYFVGFATDTTNGGGTDSTYEVWKKESGSYSRLSNQYDTGNNDEGSSDYGLPETVGSNGVLSPNTDYHLRVEMYDTVCRFYISNVLVFENTTDFDDYNQGEVGLEAFTQSSEQVTAIFDTIRVAT